MYENITYAELKALSREQKAEAWRELKGLYKTQKELALKLGVSPNLVYNMISRYVKDEAESSVTGPSETELADSAKLVERHRKTRSKAENSHMREQKKEAADVNNIVYEVKSSAREKAESFSIEIKKTVSGEDAQFFLCGIGSTLLKNQNYSIEVKITEK